MRAWKDVNRLNSLEKQQVQTGLSCLADNNNLESIEEVDYVFSLFFFHGLITRQT